MKKKYATLNDPEIDHSMISNRGRLADGVYLEERSGGVLIADCRNLKPRFCGQSMVWRDSPEEVDSLFGDRHSALAALHRDASRRDGVRRLTAYDVGAMASARATQLLHDYEEERADLRDPRLKAAADALDELAEKVEEILQREDGVGDERLI